MLYVGETTIRGEQLRFGMTPDERLGHVVLIGKTGTGKTKSLLSSMIQDVQARETLVCIDTRDGVTHELLQYIPLEHAENTVLVDVHRPADVRDAHIAETIVRGGVVLVDCSRARIGPTEARQAAYIALGIVWETAKKLGDSGKPIHLYIDGVDLAAGHTLVEFLNIAATLHVDITMTLHYLSELPLFVREAILGLVRTWMLFQTGPNDAHFFETMFAPRFRASDLEHVRPGHFFTNLMAGERTDRKSVV